MPYTFTHNLHYITATSVIKNTQFYALRNALSPATFTKLMNAENEGGKKVYTINDLLTDMTSGIWGELTTHKNIDVYRRNLQRLYIDNCMVLFVSTTYINLTSQGNGIALYVTPDPTSTDINGIMRAHLLALKASIRKAIPFYKGTTRYHLQELVFRNDKGLKPQDPKK